MGDGWHPDPIALPQLTEEQGGIPDIIAGMQGPFGRSEGLQMPAHVDLQAADGDIAPRAAIPLAQQAGGASIIFCHDRLTGNIEGPGIGYALSTALNHGHRPEQTCRQPVIGLSRCDERPT